MDFYYSCLPFWCSLLLIVSPPGLATIYLEFSGTALTSCVWSHWLYKLLKCPRKSHISASKLHLLTASHTKCQPLCRPLLMKIWCEQPDLWAGIGKSSLDLLWGQCFHHCVGGLGGASILFSQVLFRYSGASYGPVFSALGNGMMIHRLTYPLS